MLFELCEGECVLIGVLDEGKDYIVGGAKSLNKLILVFGDLLIYLLNLSVQSFHILLQASDIILLLLP